MHEPRPALRQQDVKNCLLSALDPADFDDIARSLEACHLPRGYELAGLAGETEWIYFLDSGVGSTVAETPSGRRLEVGLVGFEGFTPFGAALGISRNFHVSFMQVEGNGLRLPYELFAAAIEERPSFRRIMLAYVYALGIQTSLTVLTNSTNDIEQRLARWLLMCHDRVVSDEMALTHEFLSLMLGVRRPSVTNALHLLEGKGFIRAERGHITIRNRERLERFAGDSYGLAEKEYDGLIRPKRGPVAHADRPESLSHVGD